MRRRPRWNQADAPGMKRRRAAAPTLDELEPRLVMSASPISGIPASIAPFVAQPAVASDGRIAIGDGIGAREVVVKTWKNTPYVFMINTNNDLFFGHLTITQSNVAPWNSYPSFSGWTFLAGAAEEIAVDTWQSSPYIFMVDGLNHLYYGNLTTVASTTPPWTGQDVFSGWGFLASDAKDVTASQWNGSEYVYMTTTDTTLYFGELYSKPGAAFPPTPGQTLFGGWNYLTTGVKSVVVDVWRNAPFVYLINGWDQLYYGNLYFDPKAVVPPGQRPTALFSGWTYLAGPAESVAVSQWNGNPYLYMIDTSGNLWQGDLTAGQSSSTVPPGSSLFSGWTYLAGPAKSVSIGQWNGKPVIYLITANNDLYYRYWYDVRTEIARWTYANVPTLSEWTYLIGGADQVTTGSWQNNPYVFLTDMNKRLYQGHISMAVSNVAPWNSYVAFSGWSAL